MKDYLQPAATFAVALAIGSLQFTVSMDAKGFQSVDIESRSRFPIDVTIPITARSDSWLQLQPGGVIA